MVPEVIKFTWTICLVIITLMKRKQTTGNPRETSAFTIPVQCQMEVLLVT